MSLWHNAQFFELVMKFSFLVHYHGPTMVVFEVSNTEELVFKMKNTSLYDQKPIQAAVWGFIIYSFSSKKCTFLRRKNMFASHRLFLEKVEHQSIL